MKPKLARNSECSDSEHLVKSLFTVLTAFFALPLNCGLLGEEITCSKPQPMLNLLNSSELNCGLLSVTKVSGTPYRVRKLFIYSLILCREKNY